MAKQLIYSAVDEGIDGGRSSLCYAAASEGALLNRLVLQNILPINSYQQLYKYPATGPDPNPVNYCHYRLPAGPTEISVLSRICAAPLYGGRSNFFAHHIIVDGNEQKSAGPAQIITKLPFKSNWDNIQKLPLISIPNLNPTERLAKNWKAFGFDPGWAGWLAEKSVAGSVVHILYPSGINPLLLISDAISVLAEHQRWKVTFSTYYTLGGNGPKCTWRFIPLEASAYIAPYLNKSPRDLVLNLSNVHEKAPSSDLASLARGEAIEPRPEFSIYSASPKAFDIQKQIKISNSPVDVQLSQQHSSADSSQSSLDVKKLFSYLGIVFLVLMPSFLTLLITYTVYLGEWNQLVSKANTDETKLNNQLAETTAEEIRIFKEIDETKTALNKKNTELKGYENKIIDRKSWLKKNSPKECLSLKEAQDLITKSVDIINIKIPAGELKPALESTPPTVIVKKDLEKPSDILNHAGKTILAPENLKDFIFNYARKSMPATPLDKNLEAANWLEQDRQKLNGNIAFQTWLKNLTSWASKISTASNSTIPQNFSMHNCFSILFCCKLATENLFVFSEMNSKGGNLPLFFEKQKAAFKSNILLNFLKSNPRLNTALQEFPKTKKLDNLLQMLVSPETKNPQVVEGNLESIPAEIRHSISMEFLDHVNANLNAYMKKISSEISMSPESKPFVPSIAVMQLLLEWTEIKCNEVLIRKKAS
ncbi:MAG: hypothetical protein RL595_1428 [Planctomycetota bacterium]|jgi:hypothetical protein